MTALTFVSSNPGKSREVAEILRPYGIQVRWRRRDLAEPQADDLETVVRAKLDAVQDVPGLVLVEDSGLFIPSLEGFPGSLIVSFREDLGSEKRLSTLPRPVTSSESSGDLSHRRGSSPRPPSHVVCRGIAREGSQLGRRGITDSATTRFSCPKAGNAPLLKGPPRRRTRSRIGHELLQQVGVFLSGGVTATRPQESSRTDRGRRA